MQAERGGVQAERGGVQAGRGGVQAEDRLRGVVYRLKTG